MDSGLPPLPLPQGDTNHDSESPLILASGKQALQRLVTDTVPRDELPCLIETIVTNMKATEIIQCLQGCDAQMFIDMIDQVHSTPLYLRGTVSSLTFSKQALVSLDFSPYIRGKCVKCLYKMCANRALIPTSLCFELPENTMGDVQYRGGFAEVVRRECGDKAIAVKVLRRQRLSQKDMTNVSRRRLGCILVRTDEFTIPFVELLQRGHNLESSPAPKHITSAGGDNVRESICDGV